ncbi:MAG TPA: 3-oxoacyl-[acyl-carrier-protein] synthase III C-terminal domain-containing protein [Kofleriaceae bacterium]|nr:3-oxoacyl-[acyl-carrier-protein] synthase III C-terminal domain-containing protein [Kofleriaceae bacterium]
MPTLTAFTPDPPRWIYPQAELLRSLADRHGRIVGAVLARVACKPDVIASRAVAAAIDDALYAGPHGAGTAARTQRFAELAAAELERLYEGEQDPPRDLIHVTCTGYVSPSAAQRLVSARGWPTRVVHAYHMGCYAALPAVRVACALAAESGQRADVVHTEHCSLHFDPGDHHLDALVVQSLFADGAIRYAIVPGDAPGLKILAQHEAILPDSTGAMTWMVGDHGFAMTLARDVPARIGRAVREFVRALGAPRDAYYAVHPGGPRIVDEVERALELEPAQVAASRAVLYERGNMSSATLPHIWMRLAADPEVPRGATIVTLAFGPGLTTCGAVLEKT